MRLRGDGGVGGGRLGSVGEEGRGSGKVGVGRKGWERGGLGVWEMEGVCKREGVEA